MGLLPVTHKIINRYAFFRVAVILAIEGIVFFDSAPQAPAVETLAPTFGTGRLTGIATDRILSGFLNI